MNKIIAYIIFIIVLIFTHELSAQTRYGLRIGAQKTNVRFYHPHSSSRTGLQGGIFAYIPISDDENFYFQPEVLYMQHGERNEKGGQSAYKEKYYLDYIAVPLNVKYYISDHFNTFFVEGGPQFMFKIGQKTSSTLNTPTALTIYDPVGAGDNVAFLDISLGLGFGFSYERQWEIGIRYNYGFSDVYPETIGENQAKTNNSSNLAVGLSYIFE